MQRYEVEAIFEQKKDGFYLRTSIYHHKSLLL